MMPFVLLAAALTLGAVFAVAIPLVRRGSSAPSTWAALGASGVLMVGSAVLYVSLSNWSWRPAAAQDTPQNMVARLARRLERQPDDLWGWLMLGRSYTVLQEFPLAVRAFEHAERLSDGKNPEALLGEAEALALQDEDELDGRAERLIDRALALTPDSGQALFLGASVAARRGDLPLARQRLAKLLTLNPPQNLRPMLEQQIVAIDEKLSGTPAPAAARPPGGPSHTAVTSAPPAATPAAGSSTAGDPSMQGAQPVVSVTVSLAPSVAQDLGSAPLFVFVRDPGHAGPPLAVKRLESHFPQRVSLTPSDSMVPGRAFTAGQNVEVVARIARSGSPVAASGDPFGKVTYRVGTDGLVTLVIDRLTP
jgi:cytochrome c-type biogenesis protein CcmH